MHFFRVLMPALLLYHRLLRWIIKNETNRLLLDYVEVIFLFFNSRNKN